MERLLIIIVVAFILAIGIYIATAIFLNKFNRLVYGKGTALAWIPICNVYLLGKLTINKLVGWILVICVFLTGTYSTNINGVENTYTILPKNISSVASSLYELVTFVLFIYAIVKYNKMKKSGNVNVQQPVQPTPMSQQAAPMPQQTIQNQSNNF